MCENKGQKRYSTPEPANFDEVGVEDVALLGKIRRSELGGVRLGDGAVLGVAGLGRDDAEGGTEKESERIDGEKERFDGYGEEGRASLWLFCCGTLGGFWCAVRLM